MRITLEDGRQFPTHDGITPLSWPLASHFTLQDEREGYPRCKAVLAEMSDEQLEKERSENVRASFDRLFGHNAKRLLKLIEAEIAARATVATCPHNNIAEEALCCPEEDNETSYDPDDNNDFGIPKPGM